MNWTIENKMPYSLLLFDLDGTLVDSRLDLANAVNAMLEQFGYQQLPLDDIVDAVGDGVTMLIERCLRAAGVEGVTVKEAKQVFVKFYTAHLTENTVPYDGVLQTLEELSGVKKAVVTNKMEDLSLVLLQALGLKKYFDLVVGGDTLAERKPSGLPVKYVCEQLAIAPGEALMIGDSVNDILAGKSAGTDTAAVLYGLQTEERLKKEQATHYLLSFCDWLSVMEPAGTT